MKRMGTDSERGPRGRREGQKDGEKRIGRRRQARRGKKTPERQMILVRNEIQDLFRAMDGLRRWLSRSKGMDLEGDSFADMVGER